jgi:methylthioribose-1-phosphate isomerase
MYISQDPEVNQMLKEIEENQRIIEETRQKIFRKLAELIVERDQIAKKVEAYEKEMLCKKDKMLQKCNELRKFF